jgi:hypothetical protein
VKVEVQLINERGRAMSTRARTALPKYEGVLSVKEERIHELGRAVVLAKLVSATDGTQTPILPALHDAAVLYVQGSQLRVRGFELVDGVQYGQTWDVKVS